MLNFNFLEKGLGIVSIHTTFCVYMIFQEKSFSYILYHSVHLPFCWKGGWGAEGEPPNKFSKRMEEGGGGLTRPQL